MRSHQLDMQRVITLGKGVITELKIGQYSSPYSLFPVCDCGVLSAVVEGHQ